MVKSVIATFIVFGGVGMVKSVIATCSLWWGGDGEVCYSHM